MDDVVICSPLRTPVGRFGGVLAGLSANELAAAALRGLVERTGLGEGEVDDVILGNCSPSGENPAIGRIAALDAGLGVKVPGLQIDRRCGSGLQAVIYAAMQVAAGDGVSADGDDALPCDDQAAVYRVLETRDDVVETAAPASCGEVPGVVAVGWEGEDGGAGTAFCLGPV